MFGKLKTPEIISKAELDDYLSNGWYRMGQDLFTSAFLNFDRQFYNAIWLRLRLANYTEDTVFKKLEKLNKKFDIEIEPATITPVKEALYAKYKTAIKFDTAASLTSLLLDTYKISIFDTYEICIYDSGKLIGVGYFDLGEESAAGIVSFYDPDYKKYTLGKYLIYKKIAYCKALGKDFFYPGYFAPNFPRFDYKLEIGKAALAYLDICSNQWHDFLNFALELSPFNQMCSQLNVLEKTLLEKNIKVNKWKYEFYNANNINYLKDLDLFDYPEFLMIDLGSDIDMGPIVVYDIFNQKYLLLECVSYHFNETYTNSDGYYDNHLLKISQELFSTADSKKFVVFLEKALQRYHSNEQLAGSSSIDY